MIQRLNRGWRAVALALALAFSPMMSADAQEVRLATWGGVQEDVQKKYVAEPFTKKSGTKTIFGTWNGTLAPLRAMAETKQVTTDLYPLNPWDVTVGCDEGILEKLDPRELGLEPNDFYDGAIEACGLSSDIVTNMWAWNLDRHPDWKGDRRPKTISEAWDVKKFPGKRGIRKRAYMVMEWGLWADGVPREHIYKALGTKEGVARTFASLDRLKPHAVWIDAVPQMPQLLADGETDVTQMVSSRYYNAVVNEKKNFGVMYENQMYSYNMWAIVKGSPRVAESKEYIKFMLQPRTLADIADFSAYAPSRKSALSMVKEDVRKNLATFNFKDELYQDARFWAEHLEDYTKQFQAWLQK